MGKQPTVWRVNFLCVFFSVDLTFWSIIGIVHWWCFQCEDPIILMNNTCQMCFMSKYFPSVFWLSYVSVRRIRGGRRIWAKIGSRWKCSDRSQQRFCHHSENCIYPRSNQLAGKMMMDGEEENVSLAQSFNDDKTTSACPSKISPLNLMVNTGAFQKTKLDVKKL